MVQDNKTTAGETMSGTYRVNLGSYNGCSHRLPCGLCDILNKDCPKSLYGSYPSTEPITNPSITWSTTAGINNTGLDTLGGAPET